MTVEKYDDDNWYELGYLFAEHASSNYLPNISDPAAQAEWLAGFYQRYNSSSISSRQLLHNTLRQLAHNNRHSIALLRILSRRLKLTLDLTKSPHRGRQRQIEAVH